MSTTPKIILISAYGGHGFLNEADEAVIDASLIKPVSLATLAGAITDAFDCATDDGATNDAAIISGYQTLASHCPAHIRGAHLLLAEDNEINLEVARGLLAKAGITVAVVNNGQQALDALRQEHFDALLIDLQMQVMGGLETTRKIRQDKRLATLPVIAMTANTMPGDIKACAEAGMNAHVGKPINPAELYRTLGTYIRIAEPPMAAAAVDHSAGEDATTLPQLPGIHCREGLLRIGGDVRLYKKVLQKFFVGHEHCIAQLRTALAQKDMEGANRIVHAMKGASGNIGAADLYQAAAALEGSLQQGQGADIESRIVDAEFRLTLVLDGLALWLAEEQKAPLGAAAWQDLAPLLGKMRLLLEDCDGDAADCMDEINAIFSGSLAESRARGLQLCIDRYDFDAALHALKKIENDMQ